MRSIAIISGILENPQQTQQQFNEIVSTHRGMIKGRMGIPLEEYDIAMVSLSVIASLDQINTLTGQLGKLHGVTVKTAISKKQIP